MLHSLDNQHNGWVKGVAFDPMSTYLATQGRNGVKIWDVGSWQQVSHQREPFQRAPDAGFRFK
jgi:WD40 repeat protein